MSLWLVVWFTVSLLAAVALAAFTLALVRSARLLARTAGHFAEEAQPLTDDISRGADQVGRRVSSLSTPTPHRRR